MSYIRFLITEIGLRSVRVVRASPKSTPLPSVRSRSRMPCFVPESPIDFRVFTTRCDRFRVQQRISRPSTNYISPNYAGGQPI